MGIKIDNDLTYNVQAVVDSAEYLEKVYPIGSIYMSVNNVSPASFLGGTWEPLRNRMLIGAGDTYSVNATGGSATHTLTTEELPAHAHGLNSHKHSIGAHAHGLNSHKHSYSKSGTATGAASGNTGSTTLTINQIPSHTHQIRWKSGFAGAGSWNVLRRAVSEDGYDGTDASALATGGGQGHTHSLNSHTHSITLTSTDSGAASGNTANSTAFDSGAASGNTSNTGSGNAHSVLNPYLAVYMWKRTA